MLSPEDCVCTFYVPHGCDVFWFLLIMLPHVMSSQFIHHCHCFKYIMHSSLFPMNQIPNIFYSDYIQTTLSLYSHFFWSHNIGSFHAMLQDAVLTDNLYFVKNFGGI